MSECKTTEEILDGGGKVIENTDGTVSVFIPDADGTQVFQPLTKSCCEALSTFVDVETNEIVSNYTFDIDEQVCRWGDGCAGDIKPFKVVMNPIGNDGVIFNVNEESNEECTLNITFDYLLQLDCEEILNKLRETVNNGGLDEVTYEQIKELEGRKQILIREINSYDSQLIKLQYQLEETPFVIECDTLNTLEDNQDVKYRPSEESTPNQRLDIGFGTSPMGYPLVASTTRRYCLTDLGLQEWSNILGDNDYTTWYNSNGINTSVYDCDDVNALLLLDQSTGRFLGTCDVSITARDEIIKQINETQATIGKLEAECAKIEVEITSLQALSEPCSTVTDILETLNVCMTLDLVHPTTGDLVTLIEEPIMNIGAGNLPTYLDSTNPDTGFLASGETGTTFCNTIAKNLMEELAPEFPNSGNTDIQYLVENSFSSNWLNFETNITDQNILDQIYNEKIKISFLVKDCCVDFSILVDRIKLTKNCETVDAVEFEITKNPSFDMIRICDNKKSWLANEEFKHREFDLKYRDTQYDINNYKLAINSKEVDLDINPANAIEQDLFCYIQDNPCLLDCYTGSTTGLTSGLTGDCCYIPPVTIEFRTDHDFGSILISNAETCEDCTTTTGITSGWTDNLITNGTFDTDLSGWTVNPNLNWIWNTGTTAEYSGVDEGGTLSQDILETGCTYSVSFDVVFSGIGDDQIPDMSASLGTNTTSLSGTVIPGSNSVSFTGVATGSTTFSIYAGDDGGVGLQYFVDNVVILKQTATTETFDCLSGCSVESVWGIDVTIGCDTIYSNGAFFTGSTIDEYPTQNDYEGVLLSAATELGLYFTATGGTGILTYTPDCDNEYLQKCIKIDLNLDVTTNC
jgi:hypothetical protein